MHGGDGGGGGDGGVQHIMCLSEEDLFFLEEAWELSFVPRRETVSFEAKFGPQTWHVFFVCLTQMVIFFIKSMI